MSERDLEYTTPERLVQDFASRGIVVLAPEGLGISLDIPMGLRSRQRICQMRLQ